MQRIWIRGAPAVPTSCLTTTAESVALCKLSGAVKRHIHPGTPVFSHCNDLSTPELLADAQTNNKCSSNWSEKAAPIRKDVIELVDKKQQSPRFSVSRRSTGYSWRATPTRQFHICRGTSQTVLPPRAQPPSRSLHFFRKPRPFDNETNISDKAQVDSSDVKRLEAEKLAPMGGTQEDSFDMASDGEETPEWLLADEPRAFAIRKLALKQLAIRLMLRPAIAHGYYGIVGDEDSDGSYLDLDLTNLLFELSAIRRRIRQVKANPHANIDDLVRNRKDPAHSLEELDMEVRQLSKLYITSRIDLQELLIKLSKNLVQSHDPDRSFSLMVMLSTFAKTRQNDIADLVIKTILPYKFTLTPSLIINILNFFRKSKNLAGFDSFLQMLEGKGYPVDMGKLGLYEKKVVNGIPISVPPVDSINVVLYSAIIQTCLRFDQPDRALAYVLHMRAAGLQEDVATLMAYLKFYTHRGDWKRGRPLLKRIAAYIGSSTEHSLTRTERLIVLMVRLCDACHQFKVSNALIQAAVASGFDYQMPRYQTDISFPYDPRLKRWEAAAQELAHQSEHRSKHPHASWFIYTQFAKLGREALSGPVAPDYRPDSNRLDKLSEEYSSQHLDDVLDEPLPRFSNVSIPPEPGNHNASETLREATITDTSNPDTLDEHITRQRNETTHLRYEVFELQKSIRALAQIISTGSSSFADDARTPQDNASVRSKQSGTFSG